MFYKLIPLLKRVLLTQNFKPYDLHKCDFFFAFALPLAWPFLILESSNSANANNIPIINFAIRFSLWPAIFMKAYFCAVTLIPLVVKYWIICVMSIVFLPILLLISFCFHQISKEIYSFLKHYFFTRNLNKKEILQ